MEAGITSDLLEPEIKSPARIRNLHDLGRDGSQQRTLVIGHNRRRRFSGSHDAFSVLQGVLGQLHKIGSLAFGLGFG